jgi:protein-tyrosine kinase
MSVVKSELAEDLLRARSSDETDMHIGQLLLRAGKLKDIDIKRVVTNQQQSGLRFGDAAKKLGFISDIDLQHALARQFGYPYLGEDESVLSRVLIAAYQPFSVQAELLRGLRTQLLLRWFHDRTKVLMVASPRWNEGGSSVAANLAIVFAQLGERTLLIDANFRRPCQQDWFGLKSELGLSHVLAGRASFRESLMSIAPFENLSVLVAGPLPPNPQELLGRVTFPSVIEAAPASYDVVIVDAPPLLEYADAQVIAACAGGCLLVARRHKTRVADLELSKQRLLPTNAIMLGTVICE